MFSLANAAANILEHEEIQIFFVPDMFLTLEGYFYQNINSTVMNKYLLLLCLFFAQLLYCQIPVLEIANRKGDFNTNNEVVLQKLSYEVKIMGNIATTTTTMVFRNNAARILEGRLTFPLPENVTVSGYALDINGQMRNAVPVEKAKAKEVFESIEKRRVDPGILEKLEGNSFRTRIYPINPAGERTIQITYHQELKKVDKAYVYFLPLDYKTVIPSFKLKSTVAEKSSTPQLEEKPDGSFNFIKNGIVWVAEMEKTNFQPSTNLRINLPAKEVATSVLMQSASDNNHYFLANVAIESASKPKKYPETIGIIWDNSLSGQHRDVEKELELLNYYFTTVKNITVKLALISTEFEEVKSFKISNGNWQELKSFLKAIIYDGGTDFSRLRNMNVEEYFLFSDGLSTFGDLNLTLNKPVFTIVSSPKAKFSQMRFISVKTGGDLLNINQNAAKQEVQKLLFHNLKYLGTKNNKNVSEVYPQLPETIDDHITITGISNAEKTPLTLLFGYGNTPSIEKTIVLNSKEYTRPDWEVSQFWAQNKISELELLETENKTEIENLGKQFGIVTQNTSLIVLENVQDYARYEILPPAELRTEYDLMMKANRDLRDVRMTNMMQKAELMTENLKKWWHTEFKSERKYPQPRRDFATNVLRGRQDSARNTQTEEVLVQGSQRNARVSEDRMVSSSEVANISEEEPKMSEIMAKGKITTVLIKSDQKYMKAFENKKTPESIYAEYLKQRENYSQLPAYYFDVSRILFQANDKKLGLKVISSIADLDIENEELYKLLVYNLKEQNINNKQVWIAKKILDWRPMDAQSYRDYALALEDDGKPQQAMEFLYEILTKTYTQEIASRDQGIEETIIMELNAIITRNKGKLDISKINPKLIADLPVNIRVVLNWNKDNTDIDLWVTDPNGEKCLYSHNATSIGGRLSDDFTGGFGPEQFLLKKAIKGKYTIETNFFGDSQVHISGPAAIMAEIYINYATGKQERKLVVFQNEKKSREGNGDGVRIGTFEF